MDPAASSTDMVTAVTSMVNSLAGLANFKLSTGNADSEDEVHNAWGENDTEENLLERVHDLELARGIALGPPQSAARLRRARKNKKEKPKEATATTCSSQDGAIGHLQGDLQEVHRQPAESNSDTFTAASSMMTTMFNSFATSVSFAATGKQDSEKELGASASSHAKEECSASTMEPAKVSMAVPMLQSQSTGRDRLARRKALQQHEATLVASERKTMDPAASSTDMVTSMVNSLAGLANFKLSTGNADSEGEVHNAWGENDTEENLLERVHDLELARGIALGPPQSAARLRRARKNKKEKPKEATATTCSSQDGAIGHLQGDLQEVHRQPAESNSDTFTAASSMMTTMFNSFATSVSFAATGKQDAEKELGASASSHAKEECSASTMEPAKVSMAVPMLQSQSAGRDRLARRRNRLAPPSTLSTDQQSSIISGSQGTESQCSMQSQAFSDTTSLGRQRARRNQHVSESIPQGEVLSSYSRSTFFGVAASSLAEFQRLFQSEVSEDGESYCIWGPDDTPERYEERLKALDRAREPASGMLHHRLMQRRKKRQGERKNQDRVLFSDIFKGCVYYTYIIIYIILYYIILYYIILYYIILYYIILYYIILYYIILYYIILYYIILYYIILYYIILYYIILYCIILYYILFYSIILYYIILCYLTLHYITLHYIILYYILFYSIILYYIILYSIRLYYIILYYIILYYII